LVVGNPAEVKVSPAARRSPSARSSGARDLRGGDIWGRVLFHAPTYKWLKQDPTLLPCWPYCPGWSLPATVSARTQPRRAAVRLEVRPCNGKSHTQSTTGLLALAEIGRRPL